MTKLRLYFYGHVDVEVADYDEDDDDSQDEAIQTAWESVEAEPIALGADLDYAEVLYE